MSSKPAWLQVRTLGPAVLALGGVAFVGHAYWSLRGVRSEAASRVALERAVPAAAAPRGAASSEPLLVARHSLEPKRAPRLEQPPQQGREQAPAPPTPELDLVKYGAFLEERMREESPSGAWATQAESELATAFASPVLQGSRLVSAECRQTLCRLEYEHRDAIGQQNFNQGILQHPIFLDTTLVTRGTDDTGLHYVAFLARQGTELPAPAFD